MKGRIVRLTPDSITNRFNRLLKRGGWGNDGTLKAVYRHVLEEQAKQMDHMANNYFSELYNTKKIP